MTDSPTLTDRLRDRIYGDDPHPYDLLEREVRRRLDSLELAAELYRSAALPLCRAATLATAADERAARLARERRYRVF